VPIGASYAVRGAARNDVRPIIGWSYETVRQVCRAYKRPALTALHPKPRARPATAPLSPVDPIVRFAALHIELEPAAWTPHIICAELAKQHDPGRSDGPLHRVLALTSATLTSVGSQPLVPTNCSKPYPLPQYCGSSMEAGKGTLTNKWTYRGV